LTPHTVPDGFETDRFLIDSNQITNNNINSINNEEYNKISISDNGSGIAKEQLNKIFSPNFTTKTGGMGLGLAMVKSIVENANGNISFHSEEGVGTTFDIILPIYKNAI